ncbi:hypothetical protein Pla22_42310 [Rubripirellula amarantea]|uniref:Uncharacterized protein n=1 Tax=Rubripirellula amarantea TaxID=2527999 RepID=A0A5C5WN77_9BACT|nr:hypothetical protein [Rubripirellula amarantea]TWT51453.1 hypothetical protein Pla22_42310 [Rubripirellula amarantea]
MHARLERTVPWNSAMVRRFGLEISDALKRQCSGSHAGELVHAPNVVIDESHFPTLQPFLYDRLPLAGSRSGGVRCSGKSS